MELVEPPNQQEIAKLVVSQSACQYRKQQLN